MESCKRDIIEEYANFGSKVYAGITRQGISLDKIANKYEVQPISLQTYDGITQLQRSLKPQIFNQEINVTSIKSNINKQYSRLEDQLKKLLQKAQDEINGLNQKQSVDMTEMRKYSLSKMQERPATPLHYSNPEMLNYQDVKSEFLMQAARAGRVRQGEARQRRAADPAAAAREVGAEHHVRGQGEKVGAHRGAAHRGVNRGPGRERGAEDPHGRAQRTRAERAHRGLARYNHYF